MNGRLSRRSGGRKSCRLHRGMTFDTGEQDDIRLEKTKRVNWMCLVSWKLEL